MRKQILRRFRVSFISFLLPEDRHMIDDAHYMVQKREGEVPVVCKSLYTMASQVIQQMESTYSKYHADKSY